MTLKEYEQTARGSGHFWPGTVRSPAGLPGNSQAGRPRSGRGTHGLTHGGIHGSS